jgi:hypothetical protein
LPRYHSEDFRARFSKFLRIFLFFSGTRFAIRLLTRLHESKSF